MIEMLKDHRGFRFGSSFSKPQQGVRSRLHSSGLKASGGGSRGGGAGGGAKGFRIGNVVGLTFWTTNSSFEVYRRMIR